MTVFPCEGRNSITEENFPQDENDKLRLHAPIFSMKLARDSAREIHA
jgi:hypothetical protein